MEFINAFPSGYISARANFRELSRQLTDNQHIFPVFSSGEDLTIDVATLGDPQARHTVIISSGLHGVEGFVGSAVQVAFLDSLIRHEIKLCDCTVVLIHAINPYGFKHLRRVNEENVDLNRNFLADFNTKPAVTDYIKFNSLLNPHCVSGGFDLFTLKAYFYICRYGIASLRQSIAAGQYDFPNSLFYGGVSAAQSSILMEQILLGISNGDKTIFHVDIHSGLGQYADYKLLLPEYGQISETPGNISIFNPEKIELIGEHGGITGAISGTISDYFCQVMGGNYQHVGLEFGTYSNLRLLKAMRLENAAHHYLDDTDSRKKAIKAEFLECFCPSDPGWRSAVIKQGLTVIDQAIAASSLAG